MKNKIKKMVTVALLSLAVLGMSVPTLPASAAARSTNGCNHDWHIFSSAFKRYSNADAWYHQKVADNTYQCSICLEKKTVLNEAFSEPHQQIPGTAFCVCGYQLY